MANKGPAPVLVNRNNSKVSRLIDRLLERRRAAGATILYDHPEPVDLTVGQIKFLKSNGISLIQSDDMGRYELALGPDNKIIKVRL